MSAEPRRKDMRALGGAALKLATGLAVIGALLFGAAGSLAYVNGWIFLVTVAALMGAGGYLLFRMDVAMLERRTRLRERERTQKLFVLLSGVDIAAIYILPALDFRFGWTHGSFWMVAAGELVLVGGYAIYFAAMRANHYASRVVEIQEGQRLADTGVYGVVRHPMYLGAMLIYLGSPLVLGSLAGLPFALAFPFLLAMRIRNKEAMLCRDLEGYAGYRERVRWKLVPFIW